MWHFPIRNNDILNIIVADVCVFPYWNYSLKCVFLQWKTCRCGRFQCRKIDSNRGGLYAANRATGSELEPGVTTSNSVLTEVYSASHASDDEDFDLSNEEGKPSTSSHVDPTSHTPCSDPESSRLRYEGSSQDSDSTDTDQSDSDDHQESKSKPLKAQLLSNNPLVKRMEHLSARNLDLHDQQRLRRWVRLILQN